jgi:hypothetical protein
MFYIIGIITVIYFVLCFLGNLILLMCQDTGPRTQHPLIQPAPITVSEETQAYLDSLSKYGI